MDQNRKTEIINELNKRVQSFICPICHQAKYSFIDGYTVDPLQSNYKNLDLGGKMIPSVMIVCNNCGHIDKFSLGILGLLDKNNETTDKSEANEINENDKK